MGTLCGMDDDPPPYNLTPSQWSALTDAERLVLLTGDTTEQVPEWLSSAAQRILNKVRAEQS